MNTKDLERTIHLSSVSVDPHVFPDIWLYPFSLPVFQKAFRLDFTSAVTFFTGENGCGKSTLLEAITRKCGVHIWKESEKSRTSHSPYEDRFHEFISIEKSSEQISSSFFGASTFQHFANALDEWASADAGQLDYFGGRSLLTLSHGQSLMAYFENRYRIRGLYFLDEPETGLSPATQLALLDLLSVKSKAGAQFIVATHSPLLLACPEADILCFDGNEINKVKYTDCSHYKLYYEFLKSKK